MTYTNQTDFPPLSSDQEALFAAYAATDFDPQELLKNPAYKPSDIITFIASPPVNALVAALTQATLDGLVLRAAKARLVAVEALERVVSSTPDDLPTHHRAAAALLRATTARLIPSPKPPKPPKSPQDPRATTDPSTSTLDDSPEALAAIARCRTNLAQSYRRLGLPLPPWLQTYAPASPPTPEPALT